MKRIVIIATLVVFAQIAAGFALPAPQTFPRAIALRRIDVNAKTITALAPGKNYIVDLTQGGVVYEFSHQAGAIDLSRVKVRTAKGEISIGSYLETTFLKDKLAGFKYKSQAFSLATRQPGTVKNPTTGISNFSCDSSQCNCDGNRDCLDLLIYSGLCDKLTFCVTSQITGQLYCVCTRN
jgi:hypothetical protein